MAGICSADGTLASRFHRLDVGVTGAAVGDPQALDRVDGDHAFFHRRVQHQRQQVDDAADGRQAVAGAQVDGPLFDGDPPDVVQAGLAEGGQDVGVEVVVVFGLCTWSDHVDFPPLGRPVGQGGAGLFGVDEGAAPRVGVDFLGRRGGFCLGPVFVGDGPHGAGGVAVADPIPGSAFLCPGHDRLLA
jgi:hypothetical protein